MNRILCYVNLAGVLALGVLCAAQWRGNRQLHLELNRLEAIRLDQSAKLDERDRTVAGQASDLADLREHLARLTGEVKTTEGRLRVVESESRQLSDQRDALQESLTNWIAAVRQRDAHLGQANEQIRDLAAQANATVVKFNELATNYNAVVEDLNHRTREFNELVLKYNERVAGTGSGRN